MKTFLTFNKSHELIMFDLVALKVDLQGQQQGEGQFVSLIPVSYTHLTLPTNAEV